MAFQPFNTPGSRRDSSCVETKSEAATVHRRMAIMGVVLALALGAAGCHAGKPSGESTDASTPRQSSAASGSPSNPAEASALTAYRGMWNSFVEAAKTSDADAPSVRTYASDNALRLIVSALATNRQQGKIIKGDLVINPKVTSLSPAAAPVEASILDCVNDEKWLEYKTSGELWDNNPGGRHRTTATVKQTDGVWKVSAFTLEASGTC